MKEFTKYIIELMAAIVGVKNAGSSNMEYLLIPGSTSFKCLDEYQESPRFLKQNVTVNSLSSLIAYLNKWIDEHSVMFCDMNDSVQMRAVIDYHQSPDSPAWKHHIVTLEAQHTPEWNCWATHARQHFTQREFIHFLEDNAEDIKSPDLGPLLNHIQDVKIGRSGGTQSKVTGTEENLSAQSNTKIESGLPDIIELALRPWQYADTYLVKARPFIHTVEGSQPVFSYHLINVDRVKEKAFTEAVETVKKATGIQTYL